MESERQILQEMIAKRNETLHRLSMLDYQRGTLQMGLKRAMVTAGGLQSLPDDCRMFRGVGKMFVQEDKKEAVGKLNQELQNGGNALKKIEENKATLTRAVEDTEKNIREYIEAKQREQRAAAAAGGGKKA